MEKIKRIIPVFFLLFCFLTASGAHAGLVVCLGEDGHVSLESIHGNACNDFSPSDHGFGFKKHKKHCTDITLSSGVIEVPGCTKSLIANIPAHADAVFPEIFASPIKKAIPPFFVQLAPTTNPAVEFLRTILLLI